jgi:hypothetical protein
MGDGCCKRICHRGRGGSVDFNPGFTGSVRRRLSSKYRWLRSLPASEEYVQDTTKPGFQSGWTTELLPMGLWLLRRRGDS